MPFVRGETLRTRLQRDAQRAIPEAVRMAGRVTDALQAAHARWVVHRDIQPDNILLPDGHALVADCGIAQAVRQAGGERMTPTGLSLGTPQSMAPGQATGEPVVDARADLYALAAVTCVLLTGAPPFMGANVQVIMARAARRPRPMPTVSHTPTPECPLSLPFSTAPAPSLRMTLLQVACASLLTAAPLLGQGAGNPVEPLSNGLRLSWTKREILQRFGEPTRPTWDRQTFGYEAFSVAVGGQEQAIWHVIIRTPAVRLASGITVGSSAGEVQRVFGTRNDIDVDQYRLTITYAGDVVGSLRIAPRGDAFRPVGPPAGGGSGVGAGAPAGDVTGTWHGLNEAQQLTITADGRYRTGVGGVGQWRRRGDTLVFSGPLAAWNQGRGVLSRGLLEFRWTSREGALQYFVFTRK
jgi:hypothetical protein